jgi:hypothetical protein
MAISQGGWARCRVTCVKTLSGYQVDGRDTLKSRVSDSQLRRALDTQLRDPGGKLYENTRPDLTSISSSSGPLHLRANSELLQFGQSASWPDVKEEVV